jgi:hypothetical protein
MPTKGRSNRDTGDHPANTADCLAEMRAFQRGGIGGLARLREVLPTLWLHYRVPQQAHRKLLARIGLRSYLDTLTQRILFYLPSQQELLLEPLLLGDDDDDDGDGDGDSIKGTKN